MPGFEEIKNKILKNDYCCGCGVCAGVCPQNSLEMQFNKYGEYNPVLKGDCVDCGLCVKVCPFMNGNPNEDEIGDEFFAEIEGIKHEPETGYYLDSYVGFAPDETMRWNGASGGMVTYLLCELLKQNKIDHVVTVSPNPDHGKLFKFVVASRPEEVQKCSKSAYYPVEVSEVLRYIQGYDGRYAIVGLPCVCKAIRLAQSHNKKLKERIRYVLGLVCGQQKTKFYAEYLSKEAGIENPIKVSFREKDINEPGCNYSFLTKDEAGNVQKRNWKQDGVSKVWCEGWFTLNSCFLCDDIFAECGDVAFLDAWLPDYSLDPKGNSLVLDRIGLCEKTVLEKIPITELIKSQAGVVQKKRIYIHDNIKRLNGLNNSIEKRDGLLGVPNVNRLLKNRLLVCNSQNTAKYYGACGTNGLRFRIKIRSFIYRTIISVLNQAAGIIQRFKYEK